MLRKFLSRWNVRPMRRYASRYVLGIETSCDDTGAAVVGEDGSLLGEGLHSQTAFHVRAGGILPPVARNFHRKNMEPVVNEAVEQSGLKLEDLSAIAVTVKPGLPMSLSVGVHYAMELARTYSKPLIPIHHMKAHALTVRMLHNVDFPFMVLLISGGHCILSLVQDVDEFVVLGNSLDDAPGDAFDKTARRLKLTNLAPYREISGGRAIELAAQDGDPQAFGVSPIMGQRLDCNFSFAGLKVKMNRIISDEELKHNIEGGQVLPNHPDICANFQYNVLHHLCKRLQRAFIYCDENALLHDSKRHLVVSGGVASNEFLRSGMERMCSHYDVQLTCPPPKLCTDNGIMIAWNGIEKLRRNIDILPSDSELQVQHRCSLGEDWSQHVEDSNIKLERVKLL